MQKNKNTKPLIANESIVNQLKIDEIKEKNREYAKKYYLENKTKPLITNQDIISQYKENLKKLKEKKLKLEEQLKKFKFQNNQDLTKIESEIKLTKNQIKGIIWNIDYFSKQGEN